MAQGAEIQRCELCPAKPAMHRNDAAQPPTAGVARPLMALLRSRGLVRGGGPTFGKGGCVSPI
jgi:hypothetical protein